jgi:hypothetical protein
MIPAFKVVIAYEDLSTGRQAKEACNFVAENLSHKWQVTSQMWKFELLANRELREMAAEDAAMADLIIVSCHGERELPAGVGAWIELWAGQKGGAVALVAVLDGAPGQAERAEHTQAYLAGVAIRARMEFLAWPQVWLKQENLRVTRRSRTARQALLRAA